MSNPQDLENGIRMQEKIKVLFVDDERHILTALRALFRSQYEVYTATSGSEALDIIRREHIHIIVSDQRMPKMLGSQLLAQVKTLSPHTMRLLLTGYSDMDAIMKSINEGEVFRFITKPWDNDDIQAIVGNAAQIALRTEHADAPLDDTLAEPPLADETGPADERSPVPQTAAPDTAKYPALLVIGPSRDTWDTVNDLFQDTRVLLRAESINEALTQLGKHEVGVVISDTKIADETTSEFINTLKQEHPLLITIILTADMDSEMAINLINQGQIYRYLSKPVSRAVLRLSVEQAFQHYQRNKSKPWLLDRFRPTPSKTTQNPSLAARIRDSLRALRLRFRQ